MRLAYFFVVADSIAQVWVRLSPQLDSPANFFPNSQTATIHPSTGKIYFIGGSYYTPDDPMNKKKVSFAWAHTFDTKSAAWVNQTLGGVHPSQRDFHTTNLSTYD